MAVNSDTCMQKQNWSADCTCGTGKPDSSEIEKENYFL